MFPVLARRTLSAALAIGCISLIIIAALAYVQGTNTTAPVSLVDRVDSTVTVFIKAHDKTTLENLIKKYAPSSSIGISNSFADLLIISDNSPTE